MHGPCRRAIKAGNRKGLATQVTDAIGQITDAANVHQLDLWHLNTHEAGKSHHGKFVLGNSLKAK
jgi:hypothetical protein